MQKEQQNQSNESTEQEIKEQREKFIAYLKYAKGVSTRKHFVHSNTVILLRELLRIYTVIGKDMCPVPVDLIDLSIQTYNEEIKLHEMKKSVLDKSLKDIGHIDPH